MVQLFPDIYKVPGARSEDLIAAEAHHRETQRKTAKKPPNPRHHRHLTPTTNVGGTRDRGDHAVPETAYIHTYALRPWGRRALSGDG